MIFISLEDFHSQGNSSEMSEMFGRKIPNAIWPFHAIFIMIVWKPNTFLLRSVAPLCEKINFACGRSYITFAMRKSILDMPVPGSFEIKSIESEAKRVPRPFGPFGLYQIKIEETELVTVPDSALNNDQLLSTKMVI